MNPALRDLAEDFWDDRMATEPLWASLLGDHRFDDRLPDLTEDGEAASASRLSALADRLSALDRDGLPTEDRISAAALDFAIHSELETLASAYPEFTVSPTLVGASAGLLESCPKLTLRRDDHASALLERYHAVGTYLAQAADRLRAGVAKDRTPPAHAVDQTVRQIDEYLASPLDGDPFLAPSAPPDMEGAAAAAWREALRDAVLDTVRPAYQAFRECLADEVAPAARPSARSGVSWLPDGEAVYARAIFTGTSLRLSPDELHTAGLDAVEALGEEYRDIGGAALGTRDLAEIYGRLRDDPALRFSTSAEVRTAAEQALDRAQAAVGDVVGRLPRTPCVVEEMLDHEVKDGTIAYYQPAAVDGSRPGAYYVNTWAPETRTRFEAEALAFHEAVPGHHTQIALAQELADLPAFRRHSPVNAYVEGWALYTERLADEMGLYSDDLARLGMLSFDSWRAGRLVVDTGLHAFGWSRERAIAYLRDNSPLAHNNVANEVDRYIAWPGQALGYKVGQREILRLRAQARQSLGERFDLAGFHDAVLGQGPLPLGVLGDVVADWVGVVGGGGADGGLSGS